MRRSIQMTALLLVILEAAVPICGDPYDNAPNFIINAKMSDMALPPNYNLYVKMEKTKIGPIDVWYRLRFNDSSVLISANPVYSTQNDSALIRSINDFPGWEMFRPSNDNPNREMGYLVRIGLREWKGQCQYEAIPAPTDESTNEYDVLPELLWSDSIALPRFFQDSGFYAKTKISYYVNESGDVCAGIILESSGWALFDLFALDISEGWHYHPAQFQGRPIGLWLNWAISTGVERTQDTSSVNH